MKSSLPLPLLLVVFGLALGPLQAEKMFEDESLGKLELGQKAAAVIETLGKPAGKGADVEWEAIGEWVQEWIFPKQGLTLAMSSKKKGDAKIVLAITAEAPCELATSRGIRIGSSEAEVARAYRDVLNQEESDPGHLLVAGSVYGGVMFHLEEGKVAQIFIGAAAE